MQAWYPPITTPVSNINGGGSRARPPSSSLFPPSFLTATPQEDNDNDSDTESGQGGHDRKEQQLDSSPSWLGLLAFLLCFDANSGQTSAVRPQLPAQALPEAAAATVREQSCPPLLLPCSLAPSRITSVWVLWCNSSGSKKIQRNKGQVRRNKGGEKEGTARWR